MADSAAVTSEKNATSSTFTQSPLVPPAPAPSKRSCIVCRKRKVRCDKRSPCSNCRRANIPCIVPSTDRPPKWARGFDRISNNAAPLSQQGDSERAGDAMNRLHNLEQAVKELACKLEEARAVADQSRSGSSDGNYPQRPDLSSEAEHSMDKSAGTQVDNLDKNIIKLNLQGASHNQHAGSGFWSWINDEIEGLKLKTQGFSTENELDSSEDEIPPVETTSFHAFQQRRSEQHSFLFRQNLTPPPDDLREFHPSKSQITFLLDVFAENVNIFMKVIHIPSITKTIREAYVGDTPRLTPANEALIFSIYYVTVISMDEEEVLTSFGLSRTDISHKFRLGLEHALAKADLLNAVDIVLVQAISIFLTVGRRSENSMYVWMMTGLVIRMAQFLNLQRDGSHFKNLTPFEIEMRRRLWWLIRVLDLRASEEQGTDLAIISNYTDTKIPLNINDADLDPVSTRILEERRGVTDMSFARMFMGLGEVMMQMVARGSKEGADVLEHQNFLLSELYRRYERGYLQHEAEWESNEYWVSVTIARLSMAKMKLTMFLPVLLSTSGRQISETVRTIFLVCAIEVAEYNHELNTNKACRKWCWLFQAYTQWSSIVYLLIETARRPWSPLVERAWMALHSSWLIPARSTEHKISQAWIPIRNLMVKARKHRDAELRRLRADTQAAILLEMEDQEVPQPLSSGLFPNGSGVDMSRKWWRSLITKSDTRGWNTQMNSSPDTAATNLPIQTSNKAQSAVESKISQRHNSSSKKINDLSNLRVIPASSAESKGLDVSFKPPVDLGSIVEVPGDPYSTVSADWFDENTMAPGSLPWLWASDSPPDEVFDDVAMPFVNEDANLANEVNWLEWIESAKGIL